MYCFRKSCRKPPLINMMVNYFVAKELSMFWIILYPLLINYRRFALKQYVSDFLH